MHTREDPSHPTWDDSIRVLFSQPFWIVPADRAASVGSDWTRAMAGYQVYLDRYESVRDWVVTIYHHLHSRAMPLTADLTQHWPEPALEELRRWANQGCRRTATEPIVEQNLIPRPQHRPLPLRRRRNIVELSEVELNTYRMKVEDLGAASSEQDSPWQKLAFLHTNWCLHYQEAFLFWHRGNMLYLEALLDGPVPYWNWMSPRVAVDGDPAAGLPRAFIDETYVHPLTGEVRPNPLRYAAARGGVSKACVDDTVKAPSCRFVHRDPVLYTTGDEQRGPRQEKLHQLLTYQQQVRDAFAIATFSTPQGWPGYPWANIPTFPAPDSEYTYLGETFDGTYEQPHDNYHGWVGPDMADNAYTAFDPVFWSHHAMIDLVFELWLREHRAAVYTAPCSLPPFKGAQAATIDEDNARDYLFTNIGDLARDCRALGYDFDGLADIRAQLAQDPIRSPQLYLVFEGVRCTLESYTVDLFLDQPEPAPADAVTSNPHFVLRKTHLGMGVADERGRCIKQGVTRTLNATVAARRLGLTPGSPVTVSVIVTDLRTKRRLSEEEIMKIPGLPPQVAWTGAGVLPTATPAAAAPPPAAGGCCH